MQLARGHAVLHGRDYVIPDDVKARGVPALAHRITLRPELWARKVSADDVVAQILASVPVPRHQPGGRPLVPAQHPLSLFSRKICAC